MVIPGRSYKKTFCLQETQDWLIADQYCPRWYFPRFADFIDHKSCQSVCATRHAWRVQRSRRTAEPIGPQPPTDWNWNCSLCGSAVTGTGSDGLKWRLRTLTRAFTDFLIFKKIFICHFFYDNKTVICLLCGKLNWIGANFEENHSWQTQDLFSFTYIYMNIYVYVHRDLISCLFPLVYEADVLLLLSTVFFFQWHFNGPQCGFARENQLKMHSSSSVCCCRQLNRKPKRPK